MSEKHITKMSGICVWYIVHIFTKLSQNVYLINKHILIYWHARCNCKLWNAILFYCVFSGILILFWRPFMSELLYPHQTFIDYVSNQYWYAEMPHVTASYGKSPNFKFFFRILHNFGEYLYLKYCISTKLLRIVCLINTFILICWYARCNYKLRKVPWLNWVL